MSDESSGSGKESMYEVSKSDGDKGELKYEDLVDVIKTVKSMKNSSDSGESIGYSKFTSKLIFTGEPNGITYSAFKTGIKVMYGNEFTERQFMQHLDKKPLQHFLNFVTVGNLRSAVVNLENLYQVIEEDPMTKFINFKRRKFKDVDEIITEFASLECLVDSVPMKLKVEAFLNALPGSIRTEVIKTAPENLNKAYDTVRMMENLLKSNFGYSLFSPDNTKSLPPSYIPSTSSTFTTTISGNTNSTSSNNNTNSVSQIQSKKSNLICFFCKKKGHIKSECYSFKKLIKDNKEKEKKTEKKDSKDKSVNSISGKTNVILKLNGEDCIGLLDTGCDVSVINKSTALKYNIVIIKNSGKVKVKSPNN